MAFDVHRRVGLSTRASHGRRAPRRSRRRDSGRAGRPRGRLTLANERLDAGDTFVFVHLKATDEAGHQDPRVKGDRGADVELLDLPPDRAIVCVTGDPRRHRRRSSTRATPSRSSLGVRADRAPSASRLRRSSDSYGSVLLKRRARSLAPDALRRRGRISRSSTPEWSRGWPPGGSRSPLDACAHLGDRALAHRHHRRDGAA